MHWTVRQYQPQLRVPLPHGLLEPAELRQDQVLPNIFVQEGGALLPIGVHVPVLPSEPGLRTNSQGYYLLK